MSSRTAAGRRRLAPTEESRPPLSSKGLFFKNKSSKPAAAFYPSPPLQSSHLPPLNPPDAENIKSSNQQLQYTADSRPQQFPVQATTPTPHGRGSGSNRLYTPPVVVLENSRYQEHAIFEMAGATYIEASYQPPPPHLSQPRPSTGPHDVNLQNLSLDISVPPSFPPPAPPSRPTPFLHRPLNRVTPAQFLQSTSSITLQPSLLNEHFTGYNTYSGPPIPYATPQLRPDLHVITKDAALYPIPPSNREISVYPSPPLSHARLTPSPLRALESPSVEMHPSHPDLRSWYQSDYETRSSSSAPSSSSIKSATPTYQPPHRLRTPSVHSGSSGSSTHSIGRGPETSGGAFVFPGSRSTARPKVSKKTGSPKVNVSNRSQSRAKNPSPLGEFVPAIQSGSSTHSADIAAVSQGSGPAGRKVSFSTSDPVGQHPEGGSTTHVDSEASQSTSSSRSTPAGPPAFVFPSSRSRAQPSKAPKSIEKRQKREVSGNYAETGEKKTKFLGLLKRKSKPPIASTSSSITPGPSDAPSSSLSTSSEDDPSAHVPSPTDSNHQQQYQEAQAAMHMESRQRACRMKSRIGSYPLDPYDPVLLDNDRHTGELLARLNPTGSPTFHNYGNNPPSSVLDLGCGQGHWVIDAAIAWKGYGTRVTGYDMVDLSEGLLPWAAEQDVTDAIRFVQGNFLKQRLPFSDGSFDLIRMSCLALCITTDSWVFVLQEVCRVLMVGGRLELIDDEIFFPYGQTDSSVVDPISGSTISVAPRLDITIPSSSFSTFSVYDAEMTNPGLGLPDDNPASDDDVYALYGLEEESEVDDTATIHEQDGYSQSRPLATPQPAPNVRQARRNSRLSHNMAPASSPGPDLQSWNRAHATSEDLESLFDHMLSHKFGVSRNPTEFILELMRQVFGHAREVRTMRLSLAPPSENAERMSPSDPMFTFGHMRPPASLTAIRSPGLVLEPSTFIPMDPWEIEIHSSKHFRVLLSCKKILIEHAMEATDDEEIDEESVQDALWEYEGFLKHRLNPPPAPDTDGSTENDSARPNPRHSMSESVSSANLEDMWEIQSEFRQRFAWHGDAPRDRSSTPQSMFSDEDMLGLTFPAPRSPTSPTVPASPASTMMRRCTPSNLSHSVYSPGSQMPHIRTFRIFEAIKLDESMISTSTNTF
ncbi:hypothetical protein BJ165DRAFT_1532038 [Panaeolus papilionaceus]|nr:hypothetical protein BJ165DRAFT_1532038 [Panaeolus papilionaceus]